MNTDSIKELKDFVLKNNIAQKGKTYESVIKKNFPEIYETIKGEFFKENLYCLLFDTSIPNCPICGKPLKLRNFVKGFISSCKSCTYVLQSQDKERNLRLSKRHLEKNIRQNNVNSKYPDLDIECFYETLDNGNNYPRWKVKNYCKHGNIVFRDQKILNRLYDNHICLCDKCKREFADSYVPTEEETKEFLDSFSKFRSKKSQAFNEEWFIKYYPKEWAIINNFVKEEGLNLMQKIDLFQHKLQYIPTCSHKNCTNKVKWAPNKDYYLKRCEKHINIVFQSQAEKDIHKFVEDLGFEVLPNYRKGFTHEIDVYVPSMSLGIEFNGVFWHNDNVVKDSEYHYKKWLECKDKGLQLITIWEDDWNNINKKGILESIIKNRLGLDRRIYARNCKIVINPENERAFLYENHLQGWCQSSWRIGLEYEGELVALMTFGKSRFKKDEVELLRWCCKRNTTVIGGASRVLKRFMRDHENTSIVSYSNCEISNGKLYENLGFKKVGKSIDYWWAKDGIRYPRYKFMKSKLIKDFPDKADMSESQIMKDLGYYKVYGVGNLKYILE